MDVERLEHFMPVGSKNRIKINKYKNSMEKNKTNSGDM